MMTVKEYALDVNKDVKVILEKCASLGFDKYKEDDLLTEEEVIDLDNAVITFFKFGDGLRIWFF